MSKMADFDIEILKRLVRFQNFKFFEVSKVVEECFNNENLDKALKIAVFAVHVYDCYIGFTFKTLKFLKFRK